MVIVITEHPLWKTFHRPDTVGRFMQWSIKLNEFDNEYQPRTAMNGQVTVDFIAEFTKMDDMVTPGEDLSIWTLKADGLSTEHRGGASLVIITPEGIELNYAVSFNFPVTNNKAEYKAVIAGLKLVLVLEGVRVEVKTNSMLVANQINGEFEAKEE